MRVVIALLAMLTAAQAKDVALVLDDNDQIILRQVLDRATKALGMEIAPATVRLLNKLNTAPVVTSRTESEEKPKEPAQ